MTDYLLLMVAAFLGGVVNSVAGGGTLLTFPTLNGILGVSAEASVIANATSTVALFPGSVASIFGYRKEVAESAKWSWLLIGPSLIGGLLGSLLVIWLPDESFKALVPWLILIAASLFALQPKIAQWFGVGKEHEPPTKGTAVGVVAFQFLVSVYGGYFGAGIGILMLSSLAMMGLGDIHRMNGVKVLLATAINGVAVVVFVIGGKVHWPYALSMMAAAIAGGYSGASIARKMNRNVVRGVVVCIGFSLAAFYFYRRLTS